LGSAGSIERVSPDDTPKPLTHGFDSGSQMYLVTTLSLDNTGSRPKLNAGYIAKRVGPMADVDLAGIEAERVRQRLFPSLP